MTVRKDRERIINLPVAVICHGNTGNKHDYSFIADFLAAKGYIVLSVQYQNPGDPPMPTIIGEPYVGRLPILQKGKEDIDLALKQISAFFPTADIDHLVMIGHSLGGDLVLYYAQIYPNRVSKIITLDNLRVKIPVLDQLKILTFRSTDPAYRTDPGVIPDKYSDNVTIIKTPYKHTELTDYGSDETKETITTEMSKFFR